MRPVGFAAAWSCYNFLSQARLAICDVGGVDGLGCHKFLVSGKKSENLTGITVW